MRVITYVYTSNMALDLDSIELIEAHGAEWRVWLKSGAKFVPDEQMRHQLATKLSLPFPWHSTTQPST